MKIFVLLAGCALATSLQQPVRDARVEQPSGTAEVSGRVTTTDTPAQPVRHARVTFNSVANGVLSYSATTDDDGRFQLRELPAGSFVLAASKPSFVAINFGALKPGRPGTPIALAEGQHLDDLVVTLLRGAVITGTLVDDSGQPAFGVTVNILRWDVSRQDGEKSLVSAARVVTDDRGVYRAFGLAPGDYVVVALPKTPNEMPTHAIQTADISRARMALQSSADVAALKLPAPGVATTSMIGYAPVFYPGTLDGVGATTITLVPGEERTGINLTVTMVPTARIGGLVTVPAGIAAESVQVTLASTFQQSVSSRDVGGVSTSSVVGGRYAFASVPPGPYSLFARAGGPITTPGTRRMADPEPSEASNYWALVETSLGGRDLDVPLTLQPGMTVAGRLTFDGTGAAPKDFSSWRVSLEAMSRGLASTLPPAKVSASGAFVFIGATPGKYRVNVSGAADTAWSLESATTQGHESLDAGLDIFAGNIDDLTLTFTNQPASVSGHLQSASGRAAPEYSLIVFPADKIYWTPGSRRVRETRPATDGAYSVVGLPPGEYLIAALTDVEPGEWNDPAFLESLIGGATKVTLTKGQKTVKDLRLK